MNESEIDFIKWLIHYAEGFVVSEMGNDDMAYCLSVDIEKQSSIGFGAIMGKGDIDSYNRWIKIYYPLLLQRAIEGINKKNKNYEICINSGSMNTTSKNGSIYIDIMEIEIEKAKEASLKYIYKKDGEGC